MIRLSKQARRRLQSPRRPQPPALKTGPKKDQLPQGYKQVVNAVEGDLKQEMFIPKGK